MAEMSSSTNSSLKKFRNSRKQKPPVPVASQDRPSITFHVAPGPVVGACNTFQPTPASTLPESSVIYRNASDAAQTFLPPVQGVAELVPCVGSIIRGAICGILSILQLVDVIQQRFRVLLRRLILAVIEIHPEQG